MSSVLLAAFLFAAAPTPKDSTASTADWPQWRGPNRDGKSGEKGLSFPKDGPKLLWKNENVGVGYGQVAVVGPHIYLIGGVENKPGTPESLYCLKLDNGEQVWKLELGTSANPGGADKPNWGCGPRSTPTVQDGHIYVLGATGDLLCATTDGKKVWSKNLQKDFGGKVPNWGYSESPLVDDGHVIVNAGGRGGAVALDAKTGKTVWQCKDVSEDTGYSSFMPMMLGDTKIYVSQNMATGFGVFAKDGKLAFKAGELKRRTAVIPTPVIGGEYVFFTAGYDAGCECFKLSLDGDRVKADRVYSNVKSLGNHHGGVIGIGDHVFGHNNSGGWTCLAFKTKDAEIAWEAKNLGKGSVTFADDHFICYAEKGGEVAVIKASPEKKWEEVSRFKIPKTSVKRANSGGVWPHPTVAHGKLLLRDYDYLYAYDVKSK